MDRSWLPAARSRAPLPRFLLWLLPWALLLAWGGYGAGLCLVRGLNQTNMDNRFVFGLWIFLDLAIIALGAGAFVSGVLVYLLKRDEVKDVIGTAVVVGFACYSGAIGALMVDVGQPLRAWFTFWHPNPHSMLAEITFCLTCYLAVLAIEYVPLVLRHRRARRASPLLVFQFELHHLMIVLAAVGAFLSFFHQGSLGGLFGVLRGRPFAFREGFAVWPTTFFLFVLSAVATGPAFLILITRLASAITGKRLVRERTVDFLGRLSAWLLIAYAGVKSLDTLVWLNRTTPASGFHPYDFYSQPPFGGWILLTEIVLLALVPGWILLGEARRRSTPWLLTGAALACAGVTLNRFVLTIQTLALPTLPVDRMLLYVPSWQEVATFAAIVAYGVILYSLSYRYLPLFPHEEELAVAQRLGAQGGGPRPPQETRHAA
jgi:molybdopterin-containing oxidoreductase family membrane subunit